jgi:hypothetical protein
MLLTYSIDFSKNKNKNLFLNANEKFYNSERRVSVFWIDWLFLWVGCMGKF